jgi:RNA polymerase sigma factor (sigma-70 family)
VHRSLALNILRDAGTDLKVVDDRLDPAHFAEVYLTHYRAVAGLIYRRTGDPHITEDLTADVFLAAYRSLPTYRASEIPFRAWLWRIATNRVNRWARRRNGLASILERLSRLHTASTESSETRDYTGSLAAFLQLRPDEQDVLSLHHIEGLGIDEVALILGVPAGTVKSRLSRSRDALRKKLQSMEKQP